MARGDARGDLKVKRDSWIAFRRRGSEQAQLRLPRRLPNRNKSKGYGQPSSLAPQKLSSQAWRSAVPPETILRSAQRSRTGQPAETGPRSPAKSKLLRFHPNT